MNYKSRSLIYSTDDAVDQSSISMDYSGWKADSDILKKK